jgi:hypothetical protein
MEDEEIIWRDCDLASEVGLFDRWVDNFVFMVLEDSEEAIKTDINTGGLNHLWFKGLYLNPAGLNFGGNIAVAQEHGATLHADRVCLA